MITWFVVIVAAIFVASFLRPTTADFIQKGNAKDGKRGAFLVGIGSDQTQIEGSFRAAIKTA
jgi:hypothetical protein